MTSTLPGIPSAPCLTAWISQSLGEPAELTAIRLIKGGRSTLYFKLAVVLEGIYARYLQHQTAGEGFEREGVAVPGLIARAHQVLDTDG